MRVGVVGGGISGLAAARHLAAAGHQVVVLEAGPRWGGKIAPATVDGLTVDVGAESMLARVAPGQRPEVAELLAGLDRRPIAPEPAGAQLYLDRTVRPMPRSVVGVPLRASDLAAILTPDGLRRAEREPELPAPPLPTDLAIGDLVDQRFGPEVTDRLLEPMLGGVYAGHARELSAAAVAPVLWERVRGGGPLTVPVDPPRPSAPPLVSVAGGLHTLVDRLVAGLASRGVDLRTRATVRALTRRGDRWRLTVGPTVAEEAVDCDAVVLATAAAPTARLVADLLPGPVVADLAAVRYASVAVVTVLASGLRVTGSGLLVPPGQLPTIKAFTHSTRKWGWLRERVDAVHGRDHDVVRISIGRAGDVAQLQLPDDALADRTLAEAAGVPGWESVRVRGWHLQRWGGALPQYGVGHRERVTGWRAALDAVPNLAVCGALWEGVGIAACLRSARAAADRITDHAQPTQES